MFHCIHPQMHNTKTLHHYYMMSMKRQFNLGYKLQYILGVSVPNFGGGCVNIHALKPSFKQFYFATLPGTQRLQFAGFDHVFMLDTLYVRSFA